MGETTGTGAERHDAWAAADDYDGYMGRWSRALAPGLVARIDAPAGADWLELGCGTGSLTAAVLSDAAPRTVLATDPSPGFVAHARRALPDARVEFRVADALDADRLATWLPPAGPDVVASLLVLNFLPDPAGALSVMRRIARPGGRVAFAVWDYPGGGVEFMRAFWAAAVALDPSAEELTERRRFEWCTRERLVGLAEDAGLVGVDCAELAVPTVFRDADDLWRPFTRGTGPAPGYCAALPADHRAALRERLLASLAPEPDGSIRLSARAWAVTTRVPSSSDA